MQTVKYHLNGVIIFKFNEWKTQTSLLWICELLTVKSIGKSSFKAVLILKSLAHAVEIGDVYCNSEKS